MKPHLNRKEKKLNNLATSHQTPIEIALGIDENGMTTVRKLYEFLKLNPSNYSKWVARNILENEFAEDGVDYEVFVLNDENPLGGRPTQDFKLTAHFAKKLSMKGSGERAEEAREYFAHVEEKAKEIAINKSQLPPHMQLMNSLVETMNRQYIEMQNIKDENKRVSDRVESIREVVAINSKTWRDDTGTMLRKIGMELGGGQAYSEVRAESYELLERRMGVDLSIRLTNKRRRMADDGVCKSKRDKLSCLDVIEEDKKLIEGYVAIVKEMAIKYGIGRD